MYENFYNLTAEPFRLSPDHNFCFAHKAYAKARAYMSYAFMRAEGFVMVTGRPGTGKTTLVGELIESLAQDDVSTANLVCTQLGADDLLKTVAYHFGVEAARADKAELIQQLSLLFLRWHREGRRALLIVDEAQDLTVSAMEELRLLTNIQLQGQPLLQIFLLGQPELRELILSPELEQVHQRVVAACHLEGLDAEEVQAYVLHRLQTVGWCGDPAISRAVFPLLHRFSEGIPRRINLICARLFLHGSVEQRHQISVRDLGLVISELQSENLAAGTRIAEGEFANSADDDWVTGPQDSSPGERKAGSAAEENVRESSSSENNLSESSAGAGSASVAAPETTEAARGEPHLRAVGDPIEPVSDVSGSAAAALAKKKEGSVAPQRGPGSFARVDAPEQGAPSCGEAGRPKPAATRAAPGSARRSSAQPVSRGSSSAAVIPASPTRTPVDAAPAAGGTATPALDKPASQSRPAAAGVADRGSLAAGPVTSSSPAAATRSSAPRGRRPVWPVVILGLLVLAALVGAIFALPILERELPWLGANSVADAPLGAAVPAQSRAVPAESLLASATAGQQAGPAVESGAPNAVDAADASARIAAPAGRADGAEDASVSDDAELGAVGDITQQLPDTGSGSGGVDLPDTGDDGMDALSSEASMDAPGPFGNADAGTSEAGLVDSHESATSLPPGATGDSESASVDTRQLSVPVETQSEPLPTVPLMLLVSFSFDSVELSEEAQDVLLEAVRHLQRHPDANARITGFADPSGDVLYNQYLSQERAFVVERYLVAAGIDGNRLTVEGLGVSSAGLVDGLSADSGDGEQNRIVRIQILPEGA